MTAQDRAVQLEQVARLIVESDFGYRLADEHWSRWLKDYRNPALLNPGSHGIVAFRHAEIALSLAEGAREAAAKECRTAENAMRENANSYRTRCYLDTAKALDGTANALGNLADGIERMDICATSIPIAPTQETDHD